MDIFSPHRTKIVATLLMRDEQDIVGQTIEHLINQGVDHIIVTDNNSQDSSRDIVSRYKEVIELNSTEDMTHFQENHVTNMARKACKLSPDWIVHADADEFWCDLHTVGYHPPCHDAVWVIRSYVHFPVSGMPCGRTAPLRKMRYYADFLGHAPEFKIMHRPDPEIIIKHGNHGCSSTNIGYCNSIYRHHFPIRAFDQFERKVSQGATAMKKGNRIVCQRWMGWLEEFEAGRLKDIYDGITSSWTQIISEVDMETILNLLDCYKVAESLRNKIRNDMGAKNQLPIIKQWCPQSWSRSIKI